jgi:hypothetical protein
MSEAVESQAPATEAVSAVKGMKKNGMSAHPGLTESITTESTLPRQAMARQQDRIQAPGQSDLMGQAHSREEGSCSYQSEGEGVERREGSRATSASTCNLVSVQN